MEQPFILSFLVIFVVYFANLVEEISADPKCVNPKCDVAISLAYATQNYFASKAGVLSLRYNDTVKIYIKEAGSDMLGVEVQGKRGFINKKFVREERVYYVFDSLISVPIEMGFNATPTLGVSGKDSVGATPKIPNEGSTEQAPEKTSTQGVEGLLNEDPQMTVPEMTGENIPTQGDLDQASREAPNQDPSLGDSNPASTSGVVHKAPILMDPHPSPTQEGTPLNVPPLGALDPNPSLEGSAKNPSEGLGQILDSHIPTTLGMLGGEGAEVGVIQGLVNRFSHPASPSEGARLPTQEAPPKVEDNEDEGNGNEGEENGSEVSPKDEGSGVSSVDAVLLPTPQGVEVRTPLTEEPKDGLGKPNFLHKEGSNSQRSNPRVNDPLPHGEHPYREGNPLPLMVKPGTHQSLNPSQGGRLPRLEISKEKTPTEKMTPEISATENITPKTSPTQNIIPNIAVGENTAPKVAPAQNIIPNIAVGENTAPKVAPAENATPKIALAENTTPKIALAKNTIPETSTENTIPETSTENTIPEVSSRDNTIPKIPSIENTIPEMSPTENTIPEMSPTENTIPEMSPTENTIPEMSPTENTIPGTSSTENTIHDMSSTGKMTSISSSDSATFYTPSNASSTENGVPEVSSESMSSMISPENMSSENTPIEVASPASSMEEIASAGPASELSSAGTASELSSPGPASELSSPETASELSSPENAFELSSSETHSVEYPSASTPFYDLSTKPLEDLSSAEASDDYLINPTPSVGHLSEKPPSDLSSLGPNDQNVPSEESFPTESSSEALNESNETRLCDGMISAVSFLLNEEMTLALKTVFGQPNMSAGTLTLLLVMSGTVFLLYFSHMIIVKRSRESPLLRTLNQLDRDHRILTQEHMTLKQQMAASNGQVKSLSGVTGPEMEEVKRCYEEKQGHLEEELCTVRARNQQLEGDVEVLTANQDELHRMLNELLADQQERSSFEESVNSLQQMLDDQREVVESLTSDLALKTRLNDELRSEVKNSKAKMNKLEYQIEQLSRSLEEATTAKQELGTRLAGEEASLVDLRVVNDALRLEMDRLLAEAKTRAGEETRLTQAVKELRQSLTLKEAECQVSRECLKKLRLVSSCSGNDVEARLQEVFQIVETKARLVANEEELTGLRAELEEARTRERASSARVDSLEQEATTSQEELARLQKDRDGALAKLDVLTHHFEEKETQLKKELECQGGLLQDAEGSASLISYRIRSYEVELASCRSQIAGLRAEIEEQKESHKLTLTKEEKKAHDSWMAARAAERRQEELRQENAQLRQKLTHLQKDSEHQSLLMKAHAKRSDANGSLSSPTPLEGELSPLDMDGGLPPLPLMPPFPPGRPPLPPRGLLPGLPPPPPHLFGPPLPPPPPDRRLPPAGRMASPQGYDRYSPPDSDYSDYSPAGRGGDAPPPRRYPRRDRRSPSPGAERRSPARWFTHSPPPPHGFPKQRRSPQGPEGDFYDSESPRGGINPSKGKKTSTPVGASDR